MKIVTIIIVLSVVWQGISTIIENAAKRKEQERLRELAHRRRDAGGPPPTPGKPRAATPQAAPSSPRVRSRAEELAARRQAQLEELRKRRTGQVRPAQKSSPGAPQLRVGTPSSTGPTMPPGGVTMPSRRPGQLVTRQADPESVRRAHEAEMRRREQLARRRAEEARAAKEAEGRRLALEEARAKAERSAKRRQARAATQVEGKQLITQIRAAKKAVGGRADAIRGRLHDRATLRDLFVMKELLDPPLSVRQTES